MVSENFDQLANLQTLVTDISKINRNHRVPGTERRENVVEHSFATAMMGWRICSDLNLALDLAKVFKYALVHDFTERGLEQDFNAYVHATDRTAKHQYESGQFEELTAEFADFKDFTTVLANYQNRVDDEAWFVQTVEKTQALVADQIDGWRAHKAIGVTYNDYCLHHAKVLADCYPPLEDLVADVIEYGRQTFYDQP